MFWDMARGLVANAVQGPTSDMAMNGFIPSVVLHISSLCKPSTSVTLDAPSYFCEYYDGTLHHVVRMNQEEIGQTIV